MASTFIWILELQTTLDFRNLKLGYFAHSAIDWCVWRDAICHKQNPPWQVWYQIKADNQEIYKCTELAQLWTLIGLLGAKQSYEMDFHYEGIGISINKKMVIWSIARWCMSRWFHQNRFNPKTTPIDWTFRLMQWMHTLASPKPNAIHVFLCIALVTGARLSEKWWDRVLYAWEMGKIETTEP